MKIQIRLIATLLISTAILSCSQEPLSSMAPEVHDGDTILVTNENVEKFLTEVTYQEHDYSFSKLNEYPPVSPGESDTPMSYSIRWKAAPSAGDITATLTDGGWTQAFSIPKGESYLEITNLRPNATYTYDVRYVSGKQITKGSFTTTGHLHQLNFDSEVRNARDLGGWKTKDGRTIRYRMVYRGGRLEPETLSDEGRHNILAEGIRAQLDLRGPSDVPAECVLGDGDEFAFCTPHLEVSFLSLFKDYGPKVGECFEFIVNCLREGKPVYYNCSLGRDRTGSLTVILLGILNVDEGDISKEYEVTQFAPHGWATSEGETVKLTREQTYKDGVEFLWDNYVADGETFAQGIEKFLLSNGVSRKDIDDFRTMMLQ